LSVQSYCRLRVLFLTASQAFMKSSVFAAVPSLETPTAVFGKVTVSTAPWGPWPSVNAVSLRTAKSSQSNIPTLRSSWTFSKDGS